MYYYSFHADTNISSMELVPNFFTSLPTADIFGVFILIYILAIKQSQWRAVRGGN